MKEFWEIEYNAAIKEHFVRSIKQTRHTYISPHEHFNISPHDHPFGGRNENASAKERECKGGSENAKEGARMRRRERE